MCSYHCFATSGRGFMRLTDADVQKAEKRMQARMQAQPRAVSARYDRPWNGSMLAKITVKSASTWWVYAMAL
jgi:hypothetical protein